MNLLFDPTRGAQGTTYQAEKMVAGRYIVQISETD